MKIVFFEVADWEIKELRNSFPYAVFFPEKVSIDIITKYYDADIISIFVYSKINKEIIDSLPKLKLIVTRSTGFDHIDVAYAYSKGIKVLNVPEYGSRTVAEYAFALILNLSRKIYQSINQGKVFNFNHQEIRGVDLWAKTIGIVGLGKIGFEMVKIAKGFGMHILVYNRSQNSDYAQKYQFKYVDLDILLSQSDIISLHLPLNNDTKHFINKDNILKIKKGAILINTSRGEIVDTEALIYGLKNNLLEGVALDVLKGENILGEEVEILTDIYKKEAYWKTLVLNHILVNHPKVIITPHNAFNSTEALARITNTTIENINAFIHNLALPNIVLPA